MRQLLRMFSIGCVVCLMLSLYVVDASIEIFDRYGRKVDAFQDREAAFDDDFVNMEGFIEAANPPDACVSIEPPTFLTNFTMGKFVLINGTNECGFMTKVRNAEKVGYDVAVIYDPSPLPFDYIHVKTAAKDIPPSNLLTHSTGETIGAADRGDASPSTLKAFPIPSFDLNLQVVFISYEDGIVMKNNYLYNHSQEHNFLVRIQPNSPNITYYMYLFGAVIGVCFFIMLLFMMCLLVKCIQEKRKSRRNRLSSRQIKQIPTTKFTKGDQYDVCAICLEDYNEGDKLRILPCSHAYHSNCIDPWLRNNRRNCPLCKRKITFGDSADESDSEDSELTSPAENTPLLTSPSARSQSWGTFVANLDGSGPSSVPDNCPHCDPVSILSTSDTSSENPFMSADESENLLPPPHRSVNHGTSGPEGVFISNSARGDTADFSSNGQQAFV